MWYVSFYNLFLWGLTCDNSNLLEHNVLEFHYAVMSCDRLLIPLSEDVCMCIPYTFDKNKIYI